MTKKKIIYKLEVNTQNTNNLFSSGEIREEVNPLELAKLAEQNGFEELLLQGSSHIESNEGNLLRLVSNISKEINIPLGVNCEIYSVEDAKKYFDAGADYLVLDSQVMETPELVDELCLKFGEESVSVSIFTKRNQQGNFVYVNHGKHKTDKRIEAWITQLEQLGIGRIFLTSMANEDKSDFGISIAKYVSHAVSLPVIIFVDKENLQYLKEIFKRTTVKGVLTTEAFIQNEMFEIKS